MREEGCSRPKTRQEGADVVWRGRLPLSFVIHFLHFLFLLINLRDVSQWGCLYLSGLSSLPGIRKK
jgi:hypothetical protein